MIKTIQNIQINGVNRQTVKQFYKAIKKFEGFKQFIFYINYKDYYLLLKTLKKACKKKYILICETQFFIKEYKIIITVGRKYEKENRT